MKKEFNHISEVWKYLDQFKTPNELESAFGEIPNKFGTFYIDNEMTYEEDGFIQLVNTYWDENVGDYFNDYNCISIESEE